MKKLMAIALALVALSAYVGADLAEAKRLGGGRSMGAQRQVTPPSAPSVSPTPSPSAAAPAAAAKTATPPAASGASRWLGPIAGLAAGLGLAALLSHFGLGEGFANILMIALLIGGAVFLVRFLLSRRQPAAAVRPMQYAGAPSGAADRVEPRMAPADPRAFEPVFGGGAPAAAVAPAASKFPAGFDPAPFVEQAKIQFRKLQSAYDTGDRTALSSVMTPEMFTEVTGEITQRGTQMPTEVIRLDAEVLDVATEKDRHWMSVHFRGLLREDGTVLPKEFDEVWNLVKPVDGSTGWLLAGIQQTHEMA